MEQDKRQKEVAGHCANSMRGSWACAWIRNIESRELEPATRMYSDGTYELRTCARKPITLITECDSHAKCRFQDVCARLEMAVRLHDLDELSISIDNGTYSRHERMGVCHAGNDDHEDEPVEMGAGGIFGDYSNECDDTWDCLGDPCMVLWAGDLGIGSGGSGVVHLQEVGKWPETSQPSTAVKENGVRYEEIERQAMEDMRKTNENRCRFILGLPLIE